MTLHYHQTTITPRELGYIHNLLSEIRRTLGTKDQSTLSYWEDQLVKESELLSQWTGNVKHELYKKWVDLPEGDHLKESYRNDVWTWDDQDISSLHLKDSDELPEILEYSLLEDQS